jgi:ribosome-associated translation inhibitor RaiA
MQIQINTDHNIEGTEKLASHVRGVVETALDRFRDRMTRVEVHLSDQNSGKGGVDDKKCIMEGRLEGRDPVAVTHQATTVDLAVHGAADKLKRALETVVERLQNHH